MMYMHVKTKHHLPQTSKLYKCMSKSPLNGGYEIKCTKTHQLTMEEYKQYSIALWDAYR